VYEKPLTRKKDGSFERWLGVDYKGTKQVFRMPAEISQEEAERRWFQISALWHQIESEVVPPDFPRQSLDSPWSASWEEERLKTAKAIAKGAKPQLERFFGETSLAYVRRIARTQTQLESEIEPADERSFQTGIDNLRRLISVSNEQLGKLLHKPGVHLTGVSLQQAFDAYRDDIDRKPKYRTPDGRRKPWAKTQLDNISSITDFYLKDVLELDLGELNTNKCDEIIDVFAGRPLTQRGKPLKLSSAKHFVKQVRNFLRWLDRHDELPWDLPRKFDVRRKIEYRNADADERQELRKQRENVTILHEDMKIIAEYGTPLERLYFFLALNCAYGSDQLGRLRTEWLDLDESKIDGERLKVDSISRHHLWAICNEGLRWYLNQHDRNGLLFVATSGNPVYHETESGNVLDGFANRWNNLIGRITKDEDHNDFPRYSFGKIRKTAATEILRIADPHIASMLLAHKTISDDELLRRYANLPWDNLYEAQKNLEEQLTPIFEAAGPDPFGRKPKTYIGVGRTKAIFELDDAGNTPSEIATALGITSATVYRHLQARYGKRKPGRKKIVEQVQADGTT
jgi:hypothetical protein